MTTDDTTNSTTPDATTAPTSPAGPIVAKAGTYYRVTGLVMGLVMFVFGVLSVRDGFYKWPEQTQQEVARGQKPSHNHLSILLNQVLGVVLPPAAIVLVAWRLYNSRGRVSLDQDTLQCPGQPPVPLDAITALDRSLWDRKGIAWVDYQLPSNQTGKIKLDDFTYEREPVDAIYDRIERHLAADAAPGDPTPAPTDAP
jgi:hypothetical protein